MKALFGGALALGAAMAIWSGPAQAAQITIDLTASPAQVGFDPAVLQVGLPPGFMESLGYNPETCGREPPSTATPLSRTSSAATWEWASAR
jgi:hypothetical protein